MLRRTLLFIMLLPGATPADTVEAGARLFSLHCAACHGDDARGSGSVANAIDSTPADLTLLRRGNGGVFPTLAVVSQIDGRTPLKGHGGDMPVYGWFFQGSTVTLESDGSNPVETTEAIGEIVSWIKSIQR